MTITISYSEGHFTDLTHEDGFTLLEWSAHGFCGEALLGPLSQDLGDLTESMMCRPWYLKDIDVYQARTVCLKVVVRCIMGIS